MGSLLEKNSEAVRKRIASHTFEDEDGEEYEASEFGGFADYMRRKKIKLQNLDAEVRSSSVGKPQIFRGVVVHVNGYTQPSLNDLHHMVVSHGGGFLQYLDGKTAVTHIIASNLTPKKALEFRRYRIIKPAWVVDSIDAGKLLPWDAYRVLDEGPGQRLLGFDQGKIVSQVNTQERGYREQTSTSWYTSQVKNAADDINRAGSHSKQLSANPLKKSMEIPTPKGNQDSPESSGNFEITSSLEDALIQAAHTEGPKEAMIAEVQSEFDYSPDLEDQPPDSISPANIEEFQPPRVETSDAGTSLKTRDSSVPPDQKPSRDGDIPPPSKKARVMTAEEHNALLLADPKVRKSSTANPDFIRQYYSESRLHHLSTWKAELKSRFQQMAAEKTASQRAAKRKPGSRRYIMHVDFDSFFCAVSLKSAPEYVDKPAVVAHGSGTGSEIASCNYPARAFGVKNGMWMKQALKLCPGIKVLPYDFPAYEEASKGFYEAILDVGGIVQSVSVDEALVDITALCLPAGGSDGVGIREGSIWREQEKADEIADGLRKRIKQKTGCEVSIGIGGNILLAKVALRKAKPAGQYQVKPEEVINLIGELAVQDLPGVAYSIGAKLEEIGVKFVKDVRQLTKERLVTVLGPKTGEKIWDYSRGIDKTEVGEQVARKSVSAEVNWGIRFISQPEAEEFVQNLCIELQRRLLEQKVKGRQFTMKIMKKAADAPLDPPKHLGHGKCDSYSKSIVLGVASNSAEVMGREAVSILRSYGFSPGELRGLGVQMTKLEPMKTGDGLADGSQRRIDFGKSVAPKPAKQAVEDPIDDPQTPKKPRVTWNTEVTQDPEDPIDDSTPQKSKAVASHLLEGDDPIDDIDSPKKTKATPVHPAAAIARANASDQSAKKLNLTGSQFILPSQVDPTVLAELPQDIRSKLMAQSKNKPSSKIHTPTIKSRSGSPATNSRQSPAPQNVSLPPDFDPEVFEALPEDVKAEVLASYSAQEPPVREAAARAQTLLPQSPRKSKPLPAPKRTPTKKRGRPIGSRNKKEDSSSSTLTQSNFALPKPPAAHPISESEDTADTLDPEFLAALPEEMRLEILAEHRRTRLAKRGGLVTATTKKRRPPDPPPVGQRKLRLPPKEPRPTFTTKDLWRESELMEAVRMWHGEFREEGPHVDDVKALERYLRRVVVDERDLAKVRAVVRWLAWLVEEEEDGQGKNLWREGLGEIKECVQMAVKERALGALDL